MTCSQDQEEIVRFGPNRELNQASNKTLCAQIHVLNPFQSCLFVAFETASPKQNLAEQCLDQVQHIDFQCTIQTVSQAITVLCGRKTFTISSAYFQLLSISLI